MKKRRDSFTVMKASLDSIFATPHRSSIHDYFDVCIRFGKLVHNILSDLLRKAFTNIRALILTPLRDLILKCDIYYRRERFT